jgi:hypothetical protein
MEIYGSSGLSAAALLGFKIDVIVWKFGDIDMLADLETTALK